MFYKVVNPPQWLLDGLMKDAGPRACPDCRATVGSVHKEGCDVERCPLCGGQRISCDCLEKKRTVALPWSGYWPGEQECYVLKLVCFDTATGTIGFDLNEYARIVASARQGQERPLSGSTGGRTTIPNAHAIQIRSKRV